MSETNQLLSLSQWWTWALLPIFFTAFYRKNDGYYYRSTVSMLCLGVSTIYGIVAAFILPLIGKTHLLNWSVTRMYYHLGRFFLGVSVTIEGEEYLTKVKGPKVFVCNHQASLDTFLMSSVFPKATSVVAKKSIKYYPFLGWYLRLGNAIFLDRGNRDSAVKEARHAADNMHKKQISIWLFPEGTRGHSRDNTLLPFKKGAFYMAAQAHVPIVPVVIQNYNDLYNSKMKRFLPGTVQIKVLPPVSTDGVEETSASIETLSCQVREVMLQALQEISPPIK